MEGGETLESPLSSRHLELGARMTTFGGWNMPLMYEDISTEHAAVRSAAGLFDLCHMGRVRFRGADATALANRVQTNDAEAIPEGRTRYALVLDEHGGIVDDVLISRESGGFLLVVNAGNREADLRAFEAASRGLDVIVRDDTAETAMLAIQGPAAEAVMVALGLADAAELRYYRFRVIDSPWGSLLVSRTGYTGEDGFEIILPVGEAAAFHRAALEAGAPLGLRPCGLGCRDTLRLEAGMPLHGHEIGPEVTPLEANLEFGIRWNHDFTGRDALERQRAAGVPRTLLGMHVDGPRIPRAGCPVLVTFPDHRIARHMAPPLTAVSSSLFDMGRAAGNLLIRIVDGEPAGTVCSGTRSPTLGLNLATALVDRSRGAGEGSIEIDIRGHRVPARRVPLPFYKRKE